MKRVPESDSSNVDPGPWVSVKLQTASLRSHSTGTKQSAVFAHRLNLLSLFPVQSHHLVSRAQGAREGLNPLTRENGVSTDVISRAATKCIRKVLTWRLIEEHIQVTGLQGFSPEGHWESRQGRLLDFGPLGVLECSVLTHRVWAECIPSLSRKRLKS